MSLVGDCWGPLPPIVIFAVAAVAVVVVVVVVVVMISEFLVCGPGGCLIVPNHAWANRTQMNGHIVIVGSGDPL